MFGTLQVFVGKCLHDLRGVFGTGLVGYEFKCGERKDCRPFLKAGERFGRVSLHVLSVGNKLIGILKNACFNFSGWA